MTLGAQFGSFAEAVARDRWRTFKCEERLRVVNLGGTAIGTGMAAPRRYIFLVTEKLREVTTLPLARAENLAEQTANADAFVEVGGILSACASNIGKIADDLRLLSSRGDIVLPAVQAGSSIMPGKVNPVILEHVIQIGIKVRANVIVIAECASRGSLQICEFLPLLGVSLLESLDLLIAGCKRLSVHVERIEVDRDACKARFDRNPAIVTVLVPELGYDAATALAERLKASGRSDVREFLEETVGVDVVRRVLAPEAIMAMGSREEADRM
jgi:aspartate ammonia-lyase